MQQSPTVGAIAAALSKAQSAMRAAHKDAKNPFFKSSYATLGAVIDAIRDPFAANGLSYSQPLDIGADGSIIVETILLHSSGEWLSGKVTAKPTKSDPQGIGSLISYLRRYLLQSMVGIAAADDDGNAASSPPPPSKELFDPSSEKHKAWLRDRLNSRHASKGESLDMLALMAGHELTEADFDMIFRTVRGK